MPVYLYVHVCVHMVYIDYYDMSKIINVRMVYNNVKVVKK